MRQTTTQSGDLIYAESLTSNKTEALFLSLMIIFLLLLVWNVNSGKFVFLTVIFACFSLIFLFYSLNFRTLMIQITARSLKLKFGILSWSVPLENVEECRIDELPLLLRLGGAGIHFMMANNRYRVSLNFLEYPRILVAFKRKVGPVQDISFSTRRSDDILHLVQELISV